jgi:tetratricopeptide (TPR) repeat protein
VRFAIARIANNLGVARKRAGWLGAAALAYRIAMATRPSDPRLVAALHHNSAGLDHARGRYAEAEPVARAGLALREPLVGTDHPEYAADLGALGAIVDAQGRLDEAEVMYRRALAVFTAAGEAGAGDIAVTRRNLTRLEASRVR